MSSSNPSDGSKDIVVHVGDSWQGLSAIKNLFVLRVTIRTHFERY